MSGSPPYIPLFFWKSVSGREPVREFLNGLTRDEQRVIGRDLAKIQFGWPIGMPLCRSLGAGMWESRSSLPTGREMRVFFAFVDGSLIALHAIIKKTQKTPAEELRLARQRLKEMSQ